jgi:rod shape-determining protein MreD
MNYLWLVMLAILGVLLQSTLFAHIAIAGVTPDIILILTLFHSIFQGPRRGALFGFGLGLLEDIILGRFIGMNALSKGLTGGIAGWFAQRAFSENLLVPILSMFCGTVLNEAVFFMAGRVIGLNWSLELWVWRAIPVAVFNTCLVPFVYSRFYYWVTKENRDRVR